MIASWRAPLVLFIRSIRTSRRTNGRKRSARGGTSSSVASALRSEILGISPKTPFGARTSRQVDSPEEVVSHRQALERTSERMAKIREAVTDDRCCVALVREEAAGGDEGRGRRASHWRGEELNYESHHAYRASLLD